MSTEIPSRATTAGSPRGSRRWARGLTAFAAVVMMVAGTWHAFAGIGVLANHQAYAAKPRYLYSFDPTARGWTLVILGIVVAAAGFAVLLGMTWSRVVGVVVASLSLIANFVFLPHDPAWSLVIIVFDLAAIWALTTYRFELV